MTTQTEAERLAEIMSQMAKRQKNELGDYWSPVWCEKAAAELRRLVSFNQQLMDEVARLKHQIELRKLAAESLNEGLRLDDWAKIGCVNHDCDQCKAQREFVSPGGGYVPAIPAQPAQQEPVAKVYRHGKASNGEPWHGVHWFDEGVNMPDGTLLYTAQGITKGNT